MPTIAVPEQLAAARIWRYMSLARFAWLLQKKALWLSRADLLPDDPWEGALSAPQVSRLMKSAEGDQAAGKLPYGNMGDALLGLLRTSLHLRQCVYVNCWTQSEHESHAMWRIYCRSSEGLAIQTTIGRLAASLPADVEVLPVRYDQGLEDRVGLLELASQKRPMFSYENEVRVIWRDEAAALKPPEAQPSAHVIDWTPSTVIENIRVHPESDESFKETLIGIVHQFAPALTEHIQDSEMKAGPESAFYPEAFVHLQKPQS